ncbi:MAG TPA: hypothetical protein VFR61_00550 [Nitrososphaeraceae archaeon]|nr:hypothetical protein [Nitrososphaeraceae archaeon]
MSHYNSTRKKIRGEEKVAANSLRTLVYSIAMSVENKVVIGGYDKQTLKKQILCWIS